MASGTTTSGGRYALAVRLGPLARKMTEDEFFQFCQSNGDLRIERTSDGEVIVMPPAGGEAGNFEALVGAELTMWAKKNGTGLPFSPSTAFILPNGAERSPDFAWVRRSRWKRLTKRQRETFPPLCPDFVVEIRSSTDRLSSLQAKMEEWMENGSKLGWLIDPAKKTVYVYRPQSEVEVLCRPKAVSADPVLPGCTLHLSPLWR
jgi:Uma2 family endonuclease